MENPIFAVNVAVEAATYAIDKPYEYYVPRSLSEKIVPGVRVRVGFGRGTRRTEGIVLDVHDFSGNSEKKLKPVAEIIDETPVLDEKLIKLALWLREQCFCTFFDIAKTMLPSGVLHKFETAYVVKPSFSEAEAFSCISDVENGKEILTCILNSQNACRKSVLDELFGEKQVKKVVDELIREGHVSIYEYSSQKISDRTERLVRLGVSQGNLAEYIKKKKPKPSACEALALLSDLEAVSVKELSYFTGVTTAQLKTLEKNGIITFESIEVYRRPRPSNIDRAKRISLNEKQEEVYKGISSLLGSGPACALLHGVTGSGKTSIYFKLIERVISDGKTAILLVPEISLTPQLLSQVYSYFGERTAVMHSALSVGERYDEWKRIKKGEVDVVVGTRSAVFSPLSNIGIIIIDEEQEDTYKSSSNPRYHAREAAKFRCVSESALLLLGSATPSVESMYYAKEGKYKLYELPERFNQRPLPQVIISDLKKTLLSGKDRVIGNELYTEIAKNIENKEQTILFLNRRGASKYAVCDVCGEVPGCPNCSVPLVYHSKNSRFMCHHCGYSESALSSCKACGGNIKFVGFGTQRVEEELKELFDGIEVVRMDADTTSGKSSHEQLLNKFKDSNIPILLGTQMITKGLDFENVTLVGVLSADQAIYNDGFKAAENAFSLITQVVGRAGRGGKTGRAVIQTYSPGNMLIKAASLQDYNSFYENEIELRRIRCLPPFSDFFTLTVFSEKELDALRVCSELKEKASFVLGNEYSDISARILGPSPAAIVKLNGKYRYKVILCTENNKRSRDLVSRLVRDFMSDKRYKGISIVPDTNSVDF